MNYAYIIRSSATPEDPELVKELSEVCESVLSRLSDAITLVPVMGDEEESIEEGVRDQVRDWARDGWLGLTSLEMPDGTNLTITREEVIKTPDAYVIPEGQPTGRMLPREDESIDAIMSQAFSDIQWVIDDLRSWETNPESTEYNAKKLGDALTVIKARILHYHQREGK